MAAVLLLSGTAIFCCRCDGRTATVTIKMPDLRSPNGAPAAAAPSVPTIRVRLSGGAEQSVTLATTGGYRLRVDGADVAGSGAAMPPTPFSYNGRTWRFGNLTAVGSEAMLVPAGDSFLRFGNNSYRGRVRLRRLNDALLVVNELDLESYLAGVLQKELYPTWEPETYRALAVAARTFAVYQMTAAGRGQDYDLGDDQGSQVYGGVTGETAKSWSAVNATRGQVLAWGEGGQEKIFLAQYSACCGGRVNGAYVIRNAPQVQPLIGGQACTTCGACTKYRWPAVAVAKTDILKAVSAAYPAAAAELRNVASIRVAEATPYGRAVWVDLYDSAGRMMRLRAEDLRLALLRSGSPNTRSICSMNCDMVDHGRTIQFANGRGFGHGVGLCQWGAQGKAEAGWKAEEILSAYYPGAKLYRVY
jgi:stage II sporulation protein D